MYKRIKEIIVVNNIIKIINWGLYEKIITPEIKPIVRILCIWSIIDGIINIIKTEDIIKIMINSGIINIGMIIMLENTERIKIYICVYTIITIEIIRKPERIWSWMSIIAIIPTTGFIVKYNILYNVISLDPIRIITIISGLRILMYKYIKIFTRIMILRKLEMTLKDILIHWLLIII